MSSSASSLSSTIKTRLFIISDTHGLSSSALDLDTTPEADVAIHYGDLTDGSKLAEYRTTLQLLESINAPLKLVIAGNHDFSMDLDVFRQKIAEANASTPGGLDPESVVREYGGPGDARRMFEREVGTKIQNKGQGNTVFLDEGTHHFTLRNGASLTVFANPYTPSVNCGWGFQYHPQNELHDFAIGDDVDVVITHGPPRGVLDYTRHRERAGCARLFSAVARARPKLHCFGHIHEGWGAKLVTWKSAGAGESEELPTHFTAIDNAESAVIENLAGLRPNRFDTDEDEAAKAQRRERLRRERVVGTSHCAGDKHHIRDGEQTLFVNAAVSSEDNEIVQRPWLVDIELPRAR